MTESIDRLQQRLRREAEKTATFFVDLSSEELDQQIYSSGTGWTAHHILAHFVSTERAFLRLLEDILDGGGGLAKGFDIDRFNRREVSVLAAEPLPALIQRFQDLRRQSIEFLGGLSREDLDQIGSHPWFGEMRVVDLVKLVYRHNMIHLRDIRRALKSGHPKPADDSSGSA